MSLELSINIFSFYIKQINETERPLFYPRGQLIIGLMISDSTLTNWNSTELTTPVTAPKHYPSLPAKSKESAHDLTSSALPLSGSPVQIYLQTKIREGKWSMWNHRIFRRGATQESLNSNLLRVHPYTYQGIHMESTKRSMQTNLSIKPAASCNTILHPSLSN